MTDYRVYYLLSHIVRLLVYDLVSLYVYADIDIKFSKLEMIHPF